jgi:kinesin family protein C1
VKFSLEQKVVDLELQKSTMEQELSRLEMVHKELVDQHEIQVVDLKKEFQVQVSSLESELESVQQKVKNLNLELDGSKAECHQHRQTISTQSATLFALESEIKVLKLELEKSGFMVVDRDEEILKLKDLEKKLKEHIAEMEVKMHQDEQLRRFMHNEIQVLSFNQELKGNIRVFCRVRPFLDGEEQENSIQFPPEQKDTIELTQSIESASGTKQQKSYPFRFDKVFQPSDDQDKVFQEISQLVQSALDGYNICIFAYGQTGSGKTFTMEGDDVNTGMIPRGVKQIFDTAEKLKEKGWVYTMEAQYLEIYNETLRDLLSDSVGTTKKLEIRHDHHQGTTKVTDATVVIVDTPEKVFQVLAKAGKNRAVAATNCNERSSRSHSVFTLSINGVNTITEESCKGVLNLIDLAGSERLSSSMSTGERLKETQSINKSLSSLGDVIYALANKDVHIPYRNSKVKKIH